LQDGITPLQLSVSSGFLPVAKFLIEECGAQVNEYSDTGFTALHVACDRDMADMANYLVGKGANLNAKDAKGRTPVDVCGSIGLDNGLDRLVVSSVKGSSTVKGSSSTRRSSNSKGSSSNRGLSNSKGSSSVERTVRASPVRTSPVRGSPVRASPNVESLNRSNPITPVSSDTRKQRRLSAVSPIKIDCTTPQKETNENEGLDPADCTTPVRGSAQSPSELSVQKKIMYLNKKSARKLMPQSLLSEIRRPQRRTSLTPNHYREQYEAYCHERSKWRGGRI
jgi:hypothetical protein